MMVNKKDENVIVRMGGCVKQRCTVMLCIRADGRKLPPYVIFKRKTVLKITMAGIILRGQEKGCMDNSLVVDWIL
jgi:hypothetical protein